MLSWLLSGGEVEARAGKAWNWAPHNEHQSDGSAQLGQAVPDCWDGIDSQQQRPATGKLRTWVGGAAGQRLSGPQQRPEEQLLRGAGSGAAPQRSGSARAERQLCMQRAPGGLSPAGRPSYPPWCSPATARTAACGRRLGLPGGQRPPGGRPWQEGPARPQLPSCALASLASLAHQSARFV